jgi:hypothetical protein
MSGDGTAGLLTFNLGASNLAGGQAVWTGTTTIPLVSGGPVAVNERFVLNVTDATNNPLALTDASTIAGMPASVGGALLVPNTGFNATWQFQMSTPGSGAWQAASTFYNSQTLRNTNFSLADSVGGRVLLHRPGAGAGGGVAAPVGARERLHLRAAPARELADSHAR